MGFFPKFTAVRILAVVCGVLFAIFNLVDLIMVGVYTDFFHESKYGVMVLCAICGCPTGLLSTAAVAIGIGMIEAGILLIHLVGVILILSMHSWALHVALELKSFYEDPTHYGVPLPFDDKDSFIKIECYGGGCSLGTIFEIFAAITGSFMGMGLLCGICLCGLVAWNAKNDWSNKGFLGK